MRSASRRRGRGDVTGSSRPATALACRVFGIEGLSAAAVLFSACPISASSYVLARQFGGDATLLARLITITTIAAVATIPLLLALLT
jgi:malonate transporter and related proteins